MGALVGVGLPDSLSFCIVARGSLFEMLLLRGTDGVTTP